MFTAHPTFLLNKAQTQAVANAASTGAPAVCTVDHARDTITLDSEHEAALAALARGQAARDRINAELLGTARARWPQQWRSFQPMPVRFATWVGYDMDGRTDIGWNTCIRYRLMEKAQRLASYATSLGEAAPDIATLSLIHI